MVGAQDYAATLKGVCLLALDSWDELAAQHPICESDADTRSGQMLAYAHVLHQATGRRIGTEPDLVREIIDSM